MLKIKKSNKEGKDQEMIQSSTTLESGVANGKVSNLQLDITNKSQEVSPFPAGIHKATINKHAQKHKI